MPKARKILKNETGAITKTILHRKHMIGTRKSGVSAHSMSTEALKAVLNNTNQARYHNNARAVLQLRGIEIVWPEKLINVGTNTDQADMGGNSAGPGA